MDGGKVAAKASVVFSSIVILAMGVIFAALIYSAALPPVPAPPTADGAPPDDPDKEKRDVASKLITWSVFGAAAVAAFPLSVCSFHTYVKGYAAGK